MKVNGNKKNGTPIESQDSAVDQISQKAIKKTEGLPLKNFDAAETWKKLSTQLGQVDKRFVTWGLAMAASFSLLVAANIELLEWNQKIDERMIEVQSSAINHQEIQKVQVLPERPDPVVITKTKRVNIKQRDIKAPIITPSVEPITETILLMEKKEGQKVDLSPLSNPFVSVFAKANFQFDSVTPEIGVDFKIGENYTAKRRDIFKVGVSSQFNYKNTETGGKKVHPHTFVNLEYTSLNKKNHKGWTTRAGYLLNPDGQLYQDTTIKVSVFRNINKHIKIGPEVIFTNNMKKSYPSISLILG